MMVKLSKRVFRCLGLELNRYSRTDCEVAHTLGLDACGLGLRELATIRAIAGGAHITLEEAQLLGDLVRRAEGEGPIVEIGTLFGYSTLVMCVAKGPFRKLLTVDSFVWNPVGLP
jgi:hypothetical protein